MNWASGHAEPLSPEAFDVMVTALQDAIALDGAKNLLVLQPAISEWLLASGSRSFEACLLCARERRHQSEHEGEQPKVGEGVTAS